MGTSDMNDQVRVQGTWILSILFVAWIGAHWLTSYPFVFVLGLSLANSTHALLWFLTGLAVIFILPVCVAALGLYLWRGTRFPWLAIGPALIAVAGTGFAGWLVLLRAARGGGF